MTVHTTTYENAATTFIAQRARSRVAVGTAWSLCAAIFSRGATMVTWVVCARLVSQHEFGVLTLLYTAVISAGLVANFGVGASTTKYIAETRASDPARAGRIVRLSSVVAAMSSLTIASVLVACSRRFGADLLGVSGDTTVLLLATGMVVFNACNAQQTGVLAGLEAFKDMAVLSLWTAIVTTAITIAATWAAGMPGALAGMTSGSAITWAAYRVVVKRRCVLAGISLAARSWHREWNVLFAFSLPAMLTSILMSPISLIMQLWISRLPDGLTQLALYGAAERWRLIILFVPSSMFQAALPVLSNMAATADRGIFQKVVRDNFVAALVMVSLVAGACALLASSAMSVFGHSYQAASGVLMVLSLAAVPQVLNGVLGQAIVTKSMWTRLAFDALLFVLLLGSSRILIARSGAVGAAIAYLLAFTLVTPFLFLYSRYHRLV